METKDQLTPQKIKDDFKASCLKLSPIVRGIFKQTLDKEGLDKIRELHAQYETHLEKIKKREAEIKNKELKGYYNITIKTTVEPSFNNLGNLVAKLNTISAEDEVLTKVNAVAYLSTLESTLRSLRDVYLLQCKNLEGKEKEN